MANGYDQESGSGGAGFMMGLLAGTVIGAGLGMLLAPKTGTELRDQLGEQARNVGNLASEKFRKASETAGDWAKSGREAVNSARDAMARGAEEVRGYSNSARDVARDAMARGAEEVRNFSNTARDAASRGAEEVRNYSEGQTKQFGGGS